MKRFIVIFALLALYLQPPYAFAQNLNGESVGETGGSTNPVGYEIQQTLDSADPLQGKFTSIGDIISQLLPYLLTIAGLILFGMLIWGGIGMMTAVSNPKAADAAKGRITAALIGFIILFASYWIAQIIQIIFGVNILG